MTWRVEFFGGPCDGLEMHWPALHKRVTLDGPPLSDGTATRGEYELYLEGYELYLEAPYSGVATYRYVGPGRAIAWRDGEDHGDG